jgi:hypothetical protein
MRTCYAIALAVPAVAIDALDRIVPLPSGPWVVGWNAGTNRHHAELLLLIHRLPWLSRREEVVRLRISLSSVWGKVRSQHSSWEVLRDLNLDIAEIALSSSALALLLVRIVGLRRSRRPSLQSAVPVVRDERLALVALSRTVGVDIIYMGEIRFEPVYIC